MKAWLRKHWPELVGDAVWLAICAGIYIGADALWPGRGGLAIAVVGGALLLWKVADLLTPWIDLWLEGPRRRK